MAFALIPVTLAETAATYTDLTNLNLIDIVYLFVALAILGAGALSIVFIFFGGFSFILSGGDEGKVKTAIHTIRYAIIGLIISLLSLVFVPLVGDLFNLNLHFFDFATLSNRINILFSQFNNNPTTTTPSTTSTSTTTTTTSTSTRAVAPLDQVIR
ncbi:MAG: hypothetical protein PHO48_01650 [Candidatus Gracilibacteria bacterium]|nr:hypothetical protein [Candidatus Gracilibacteria bacterium]MDD5178945.1 hypothetical protein [Candidatus Gracilibacteria bacterium]